jgi:hypothetical protein
MRLGPFPFVGIFLFLVWIAGFVIFHVAGALIHLFILFVVIPLVLHLFWARG